MRIDLDDAIQIVTPENIGFQYRVAGPFLRLPAYLIDLAIRFAVVIVSMIVIGIVSNSLGLGGMGTGVAMVLIFLFSWFYGGLFETFWNGQTPGKRLMGLRVLTTDGRPINGMQAVLRNLLRAIDCQPGPCYLVGLISASANARFQRLGDLACGTMVVVEQKQWWLGLIRSRDRDVLALAERLPVGFEVSRTLGRTLAAYVQRCDMFSLARRQEIAAYLAEPLRERLDLPDAVADDLLLRALYHRAFIGEMPADLRAAPAVSPFKETETVNQGSPFQRPSTDSAPSPVETAAAETPAGLGGTA